MKKFIGLILFVMLVVGCQDKPAQSTLSPTQMNLGHVYKQENISFEIIDIVMESKILPSCVNDEYDYIESRNDDEKLLDIILRVHNFRQDSLKNNDILAKLFVGENEYTIDQYIESQSFSHLSQTNEIAQDQAGLIHLVCNVKEDVKEQKALLTLKIQDQDYCLEFIPEVTRGQFEIKNMENGLNKDNLFSMKFVEVGTTKEIVPLHQESNYKYYELENKNNLYLYVICDFENKSDRHLTSLDIPSLKFTGKERYAMTIVRESEDQRGFQKENLEIKSSEKCRLFFFKEVSLEELKEMKASKKTIDISYLDEKYCLEIPYEKIDVE